MTKQLDMFDAPIVAPNTTARTRAVTERRVSKILVTTTIDQRFEAFAAANPHVMTEMLRLAHVKISAGATRIGAKALWEELRVSLKVRKFDGWKLNNNYTAPAARKLVELDASLAPFIETRRRKS